MLVLGVCCFVVVVVVIVVGVCVRFVCWWLVGLLGCVCCLMSGCCLLVAFGCWVSCCVLSVGCVVFVSCCGLFVGGYRCRSRFAVGVCFFWCCFCVVVCIGWFCLGVFMVVWCALVVMVVLLVGG